MTEGMPIRTQKIDDATMLAAMIKETGDVTALLEAWRQGEDDALPRLMDVVQQELLQMARGLFRGERQGHTLQPTALVNEVYLKLQAQRRVGPSNRAELFAVAARLMRRILVDHARKHLAEKRGSGTVHLELDEGAGLPRHLAPEMLSLDDALLDLERRSPRQSQVVEMRVLVGLSLEEIAGVLRISLSTVSREWKAARLFLLSQLRVS